MGPPPVDRLVDELEASYEWRQDAPGIVAALLAGLPTTSAAQVQRARLVLLSVHRLIDDEGAAGAALAVVEIRDRVGDGGHRGVRARAERALSRLFLRIGDFSGALEHAMAALALDGEDLDPALRCQVRLAMAGALGESGSFEDARGWNREALEHAGSLRAPWSSLLTLNNWAYTELVAGDPVAAWGLAARMRDLATEHGTALNLMAAGTVAETLHAVGRAQEAVATLRQHLGAALPGTPFDVAGCWLTLARIERETGDLDAAEKSLETAEHLTTAHELRGMRVEGLGSRAELLAARGDHAGAYALHRRFHAETLGLRSQTSDARAQTLHAVFEVDRARRESTRYREMSRRDPLTGLHNRRHVDEDLDRRLAARAPLAVAMVDVDHFKRVNDTCSHEAGDAVLARLATLLATTTASVPRSPDAYAARLGGEEFLLVLPGLDLPAAREVAEDLRRRIEVQDWSDVAPGLPVTASIGLAATRPAQPSPDRADLLRRADTHLYAAKDAGRNRVEPATGPEGPG